MDKPKCRLCGARHGLAEPHVYSASPVTPPVTESSSVTPIVTVSVPSVTSSVTRLAHDLVADRHACPICGLIHGGALTTAERSRAYRQRRRSES